MLNLLTKTKNKDINAFILYLIIFFSAWSLKEIWLVRYIYSFGATSSALFEALIKSFIWIVPVWLYVKFYIKSIPKKYLRLDINIKAGFFWGIFLSFLLFLRFGFEVYIINEHTFIFSLPFYSYLNDFILVGITEEVVFRGFILQEINKRVSFWKANLITSLLFLFIHYPIWIYNGEFLDFGGHIYLFLLSLSFGFVYKKTGSLWSVILLHSFHNFFLIIL